MGFEVEFLISGLVLGLSGGLSPGPLLTLVVSETLRHGAVEGMKVAIAPLLTDLPIVLAAVFVLSRLAGTEKVLGVIFLLGGAFLAYLGIEGIAFKGTDASFESARPRSIRRGVIANFLNPSPYLFWLSIGAPTVFRALQSGMGSASAFIVSFYVLLVGAKVLLACVLGRYRTFLKSSLYIYALRLLGVVLLLFALRFFVEGARSLGWL